jgi:hypothetical protein
VEVLLYDPWKPQLAQADLVHYFSVQGGSMNFCDYVKRIGLPLLISPVLWLTPENRDMPPGDSNLPSGGSHTPPNSRSSRTACEAFQVDRESSTTPNGIDRSFCEPADACVPPAINRRPVPAVVANIEPRNQLRLISLLPDRQRSGAGATSAISTTGRHARMWPPRVRYWVILTIRELLKSGYAACAAFVLQLVGNAGTGRAERGKERRSRSLSWLDTRVFRRSGGYADPLDEASIRASVIGALEGPRDARLKERILQNFTWDHTAETLIVAYSAARIVRRVRG